MPFATHESPQQPRATPPHHATEPPGRGYSGSLLLKPQPAEGTGEAAAEGAAGFLGSLARKRIRPLLGQKNGGTNSSREAEQAVAEQVEAAAVPPAQYGGVAWHGTCEYYEVQAVPGSLLLFPSWLLHCVLPLYNCVPPLPLAGGGAAGGASEQATPPGGSVRISAAYNFDLV